MPIFVDYLKVVWSYFIAYPISLGKKRVVEGSMLLWVQLQPHSLFILDSDENWVQIPIFVRMNAWISKIIRDRTIKFGNSNSNYCTQVKLVLKVSHALNLASFIENNALQTSL